MIAELIRPSLLEFITKRIPGLDSEGFICFDDLGEFRKNYVKEVLEEEIGELSALDQEVIESLRTTRDSFQRHQQTIRTETDFRRTTLRPHRRVRRQLEISHHLWRGDPRLDRH